MLITTYDLDVFTPPCEPGGERFCAIGRLKEDISPVFPYLNATLRGAVYHPGAPSLTWKKAGHNIAFNRYEIAISNAADRDGAETELRGLIELVNRTWERRNEITPSTEVRRRPTVMALYQHLPRSNCQLCGEPTCWIFASRLATAQKTLEDCPPLSKPENKTLRAALTDLIIEAPIVK